jgi:hypothetical protein
MRPPGKLEVFLFWTLGMVVATAARDDVGELQSLSDRRPFWRMFARVTALWTVRSGQLALRLLAPPDRAPEGARRVFPDTRFRVDAAAGRFEP